jgi:uncharacterized BrkB/YihY/UPF0761 family membrane protein
MLSYRTIITIFPIIAVFTPISSFMRSKLHIRRVAVKKAKDTISANQMPSIQKHTKTKKAVEKEIIQFLNEASTKEGKSTKPG